MLRQPGEGPGSREMSRISWVAKVAQHCRLMYRVPCNVHDGKPCRLRLLTRKREGGTRRQAESSQGHRR